MIFGIILQLSFISINVQARKQQQKMTQNEK